MSVRIIIDSAADMERDYAADHDVTIIPLKTIFGEVEYADGIDLTSERFYEKLVESDALPHTSQISPFEFAEAFRAVAAEDDIVVITLSGKLSGTCQSARIAAADPAFAGRVFVVDSENATVGERILVERAIELRDAGVDAHTIAEALDAEKHEINLMAVLDTLEYLKRGGRISATTAAVGSLLSIKPVVGVVNGEVVMLGKARGSKQGNNLLRQKINETGVDFSRPLRLAYSGFSDTLLRKYVRDSRELFEAHRDKIDASIVGSVIGTHVGPGAIAVAYFAPRG